ncbi:ribonuclease R [Acholeplasma equirhinis]|uniref:ribonuclease R n=1 Tax=Acholeplasma equirhinis TaxID=555393 RepID=UPI00197AD661|nr:ribonuclease R [Acholeplasma equirhinis]MBN3490619.1 ribonuclease R [Acholeplasma equirhinis]
MELKQFIAWYFKQNKQTITIDEMKDSFGDELEKLVPTLTQYFDVNQKGVTLKHKYKLGIVQVKKHAAFLLQKDGDMRIDLYDLNGAMDNDLVLVNHFAYDPYVVDIIQSSLTQVIAIVRKSTKFIRFDATNIKDKLIMVKEYPDYLVDGHVIMLKVDEISQTKIFTTFVEVIGHQNDPDIEIVKIINEYGWPHTFSKEILNEIASIKVDETYETKTRRDLREELIVTIDGEDAKDLDDAVSYQKLDNGNIKIGVHIADVSYFVKEGSALDQEAYRRATSVYLADRVIPMLPHSLSNDLCSLNPHEAKYTISCEMVLNDAMEVVSYEIFPSIIESKFRLTYTKVNALIKENISLGDEALDTMIVRLNEVAQKLKMVRSKRGAIDFESSELKFEVDIEGRVLSVKERKTEEAEGLIESFMILANEVVATHFHKNDLPGIYRVHEKPDTVKLEMALESLRKIGFPADKKEKSTATMLQRLTKGALETKYQYIVHMILLRSMQKAKYDPNPIGHFGLGSEFYSHFTSPIRRYPDLLFHRMIRNLMFNGLSDKKLVKEIKHFEDLLPEYSEHTSIQERIAIDMERDVTKLKSCEYMSQFVGDVFDCVITQFSPAGFYVKLTNGIEGFVHIKNVNEYLMFDEEKLLFYSESGKKYRLGDQLKVKLLAVDMVEHKIDFTLNEKRIQKNQGQKINFKSSKKKDLKQVFTTTKKKQKNKSKTKKRNK